MKHALLLPVIFLIASSCSKNTDELFFVDVQVGKYNEKCKCKLYEEPLSLDLKVYEKDTVVVDTLTLDVPLSTTSKMDINFVVDQDLGR